MKRTVKTKNLISFTVVLILLLSISVSSFAAWNPFDYQRNRAFVAAALTALNIAFQTQQMNAQSVVEYIADPMNVNYTYVDAWQDRPQIQIWDDYVTIDGTKYTDVWISNEAAEKFRIDAYDFKTAYNIASNSSATFASGVGFANGEPIYSVNGVNRSVDYILPAQSGVYSIAGVPITVSYPSQVRIGDNFQTTTAGYYPAKAYVYTDTYNYRVQAIGQNGVGAYGAWIRKTANNWVSQNFDFDYVATDIPASQVLPEDTGMMIRIPSEDPQGNKYLGDFLTDYPEFNQGEPVTIDVNLDPDIMNKLDDLINIIMPIIPHINNNLGDVTFVENHEAPAPVPDTPIVDATVPQVVNPIINEITNYGDQISNQIPQIIETIPNITDICNNIDTAPYHDLDTGLDHLPSIFLPFITDLRSALGIWHYVTEWIGQISTTFAFVTGCLVGTSIMTPIYAAIAGFMCIKVYRRMTG